MIKTYTVNDMSCVICKNTVEKGIKALNGVVDCKVNLLENEATITFNEDIVSEQIFIKTVKDLGYELVTNNKNKPNYQKVKLIISILLVLILMYLSMGHMINLPIPPNSKYYQLLICTIIIILNNKFYKSGFRALLSLKPNMDSLVSLSSSVSYIYSLLVLNNSKYHLYFETSAMVLVIVSIGKYIEGQNKNKVSKVVRGLATLIPMQANLLINDEVKIIPIDNLKKDDIVLVKPGESIPQDGIIISGSSTVDESMITGESIAQTKTIDDEVIGGTININGKLIVKVTKNSSQTTLSKIISLTKQATMSKIKIERFADTISKYFVFAIIGISIFTFIIWILTTKDIEKALNFSLSVLVISCPCALGLATPSAIMVATGVSAKNGVLIKNPEILEIAYKLKYMVFDKTGTLTSNNLGIVDIKEYDTDFINVLSSLEKLSNHPISQTIIEKYPNGNLIFDHFELISAKGIVGKINNDIYFAGNKQLASEYIDNIDINENSYSYVIVGKNSKLLGIVYLADIIRPSSFMAIKSLINKNITPIMCTGDNENIAKIISDKLGIKDTKSKVTPSDKNDLVIDLKKDGIVGMIGDGVNDAVALSSADVSFTISSTSDIAYATSDIVLMSNNINDISFVINLSKKTMKIIKQNLFWALFYNAIFIPIASGIFYNSYGLSLNPMIGAATMSISSIFVLSNALRINSVTKEELKTMNKTVTIEGMMCNNCAKHAHDALTTLGAEVKVVLQEKKAYLTNTSLTYEQIKDAIEKAGYEVVEIING